MFSSINKGIIAAKRSAADHALINEAVLDVDEDIIPGSEEELDDVVDPDSVPDEVYQHLDKELDKMIAKDGYDDADAEELVDDDVDEDELSDGEIDAVISEACGSWIGDETL